MMGGRAVAPALTMGVDRGAAGIRVAAPGAARKNGRSGVR
jgi:hypothetical protein